MKFDMQSVATCSRWKKNLIKEITRVEWSGGKNCFPKATNRKIYYFSSQALAAVAVAAWGYQIKCTIEVEGGSISTMNYQWKNMCIKSEMKLCAIDMVRVKGIIHQNICLRRWLLMRTREESMALENFLLEELILSLNRSYCSYGN